MPATTERIKSPISCNTNDLFMAINANRNIKLPTYSACFAYLLYDTTTVSTESIPHSHFTISWRTKHHVMTTIYRLNCSLVTISSPKWPVLGDLPQSYCTVSRSTHNSLGLFLQSENTAWEFVSNHCPSILKISSTNSNILMSSKKFHSIKQSFKVNAIDNQTACAPKNFN